ncbi:MAG: hypothetical protein Ta2A_26220 [Treponemataceae bacterium]|nr:MAG: hypothetical protein Ta2A_26220 [Treponemataceae bacterium]
MMTITRLTTTVLKNRGGNDWYGVTGNAVRTDVMDDSLIPGGKSLVDGHWLIPRESPWESNWGVNNIGHEQWKIIVESLSIPAADHTISNREAFWSEASMGPLVGFLGLSIGTAIVATALLFALFVALASSGVLIANLLIAAAVSGVVIGVSMGALLQGKSIFEMLYKPAEDDYEMADEDEDLFPTIVFQRFDNYVCYDPDPVHAL